MTDRGVLRGYRVLCTRPAAQGEALAALLREHGAEPVELPLFRIEPHGDTSAQAQFMDAARTWNGWIFTSANAALRATALDQGPWPTLFAIGAATARSLAVQGRPGALCSAEGSTSEALLDHPALRAASGQRFLLCTGVGGRDVIETALSARGAQVERLELYARVPVEHSTAEVLRALESVDAILCTSGESVERLHALAPAAARATLLSRLLVVPSQRVLELARRLGFLTVRAPAQTSDEALVACLEQGLSESAQPPT